MKKDYFGVSYDDVDEEFERQEDRLLDDEDRRWLQYIVRTGFAVELHDLDGLTERELHTVYDDLRTSVMVEVGYVEIGYPHFFTRLREVGDKDYDFDWREEDGYSEHGVIEARVTPLGKTALSFARQDIMWSTIVRCTSEPSTTGTNISTMSTSITGRTSSVGSRSCPIRCSTP
jgi:hypothetical protein